AEAASQSAAAAKKSETAAASSKNAAKTSETNAANSAQAAAASQTASANSATAAKKSETNAKNSETAAKTSETNAKSSQTAAKTSETNAKASETAAKSSQDAAAESESAAAGSATSAAATAAKKSETNAKNSETAAKTSETNAKSSQTAAKTSETNAKASETAAKSSQDAAAESESAAAGSATSAAGSATAAANSQKAAKTSETNAKSSQTAAKTSETNAKASETAAKSSQAAAAESESAAAGSASAAAASATASANSQKAAKTSETNAKASETAAANSAKASAASQTAAKASEDAAREYASQAAEPYKYVLQPLPEVWIPFNDSLDMITGFAPGYKSITVGDDVIALPSEKVVSFTRASTATYIDKSGCFAESAINEPRFEKDGLLIEGQRTNTFSYTNTPVSWNYDTANLTITTGVDEYGFSYGLFGVKETSTTERATLISTGYTRVISVSANESVTLSCRVKKVSGDGIITLRPRISYVNDDGSSNTLTAGAYIDCETGDMLSYSGGEAATYNIFRESNGWIRVEFTYKSPEAKNMYGRFEFGAHQRSIKSGDKLMLTTPQFEKGLNASSFIITTEVGATRASDQVIIPIPFNWATPPVSVLMEVNVNWDSEMPNLEGSARLLNISITGATTEVSDESYMYFGFTTRGKRLIITNGKGTKTEYKAYGNREKRKFVTGFKFTEDKQLQVVVDGILGGSSPSLHTLQRYTAGNINIGGQSSSGNRHLFGHVKNLRIWHKELTEAQMGESI
ncbi:phage head spike fiber domain-containing protein, partial [Escherichia coli]|uniref:phage head spike fiber domain-containing protein n=1 Tax=Escherichia coli TaxID=562 RepID=UPI00050BD436